MKILKENIRGEKSRYKTSFSYSQINKSTYRFIFIINDTQKISFYKKLNQNHYESNVVELFFKSNLEENRYLEIEVAPNNSHFIAYIEIEKNGSRTIKYIEEDFSSKIINLNNKTQMCIINIDLSKYIDIGKGVKFNAFRIENEKAGQYLMALNPTLCDTFHVVSKFINLKNKF